MSYILNDYDFTLQKIIKDGKLSKNRTGVNTLSLFGVQCHYDISKYFPIPTKRKYSYRSILSELIWMLSGSTNINDLEAMGSKIWTPWRNKEFELKNNYVDGELGPIYGWQFRSFGGQYPDKTTGFDQVSFIIDEIKRNRDSRRLLINLWNPNDMHSSYVALPCCHFAINFLIDSDDNITGILHQRSGDWLPGVSANVIFYSALIYMVAQQTGMKPYKLVHNVDNAHVYVNQLKAAEEYLSRQEIDSPSLTLTPAQNIFEYKKENFIIKDYNPLDSIKVPVLV